MSWKEKIAHLLGVKPPERVVVKEVPVYKVIQVKTVPIQAKTKEIRDAIKTLPAHPGFQALLDDLALQRQFLESKSCNEFHKDLREGDFIQSGIYWLNYVQAFVDRQTETPRRVERDAMAEELEAFKQIDAQIERVGMKQ